MRRTRWMTLWRSVRRFVMLVQHGLGSPYLALVVLLALFAIVLMGALLPQRHLDSRLAGSSIAYSAPSASRWGPLGTLFTSWGWLDLFRSRFVRWLLTVIAGLALWWLLMLWYPAWRMPPRQRAAAFVVTLPLAPEQALGSVARALALDDQLLVRLGQRAFSPALGDEPDGWSHLSVAHRRGVTYLLPGLLPLGVLILALATWTGARWGWQGPLMEMALGETRPLQPGGDVALRLEQIELRPRVADGRLAAAALFSLWRGAQTEGQLALAERTPAQYEGLSIYQVGLGPAARISARDALGRAVDMRLLAGDAATQRSLRLRFTSQEQEQQVAIPDADMVIRLVHYPALPGQGVPGRVLHVQLLRGTDGQLLEEQLMDQNGTIATGSIQVDVVLEYYVALRVEREPELPLALVAGLLLVLGVLAYQLWPPRSVWVVLRPYEQGSLCQLFLAHGERRADWLACTRACLYEDANDQ